MTTLFLPSLEDQQKTLVVSNVSKTEAIQLIAEFDARVKANRKIGNNPNASDKSIAFFTGSFDLHELDGADEFEPLLDKLQTSDIVGMRGKRAVFADIDTNEVGVGTTVVYNRNWAMLGVEDDSINIKLMDAMEAVA